MKLNSAANDDNRASEDRKESAFLKVIDTSHPTIILRGGDALPQDMTGSGKAFHKSEVAFLRVPVKPGKKVTGALAVDGLFNNLVPMSFTSS